VFDNETFVISCFSNK